MRVLAELIRFILVTYVLLCVVSLILVPLRTTGALWLDPDPTASVYGIDIALPWTIIAADISEDGTSPLSFILVGFGMAVNTAILFLMYKAVQRDG